MGTADSWSGRRAWELVLMRWGHHAGGRAQRNVSQFLAAKLDDWMVPAKREREHLPQNEPRSTRAKCRGRQEPNTRSKAKCTNSNWQCISKSSIANLVCRSCSKRRLVEPAANEYEKTPQIVIEMKSTYWLRLRCDCVEQKEACCSYSNCKEEAKFRFHCVDS